MKKLQKSLLGALGVAALAAVGIVGTKSTPAQAQVLPLPSPAAYVSNLDLECYRPGNTTPPLVNSLTINHLNPVLRELGIDRQKITVGALQEVCVPVTKNEKVPPALPLRYLSYTDLACYRAQSQQQINVPLNLTHLNPVLRDMGIGDAQVVTGSLEQLCTPVEKRGAEVPNAVKRLVRHVDVACYRIQAPPEDISLRLDHQNPLLRTYPQHKVRATEARQLCLPVAKDNAYPPDEILKIVQWVDLEKFAIETSSGATPLNLVLTHLNPRFQNAQPFVTYLPRPTSLMVPVAKNWRFPPQ